VFYDIGADSVSLLAAIADRETEVEAGVDARDVGFIRCPSCGK
jgi:hypothetical protein